MFDLMRKSRLALVPLALTGAMFVAACSDDDEEPTETATTVATAAATTTATATATEEAGETIEVTAVDYAFENLPATAAVGTMLSLTNASDAELHELVTIRLADDETRTLEELLALPEEEANTVLSADPGMVLIAPPGEAGIAVVGDGALTEAGRYIVVCAIPQGVDPAEYLAAAQTSPDGPPQIEGAGPPHFMLGMIGEITVE